MSAPGIFRWRKARPTDMTNGDEGRASRFLNTLNKNRGPLLVALVVVVFFFQTLILTKVSYFADSAAYYYPARVYMASVLRSGHLPLMCPKIYSGYPLFADSETGLFYPINFASFFIPNLAAFNYSLFIHYLAIGLFTYLYARTIKLSRTAAVFAGLAFVFSGFSLAHLGHVNIINTLAWFPLILYLIEKGMRKDSFAYFLCAGFALGMQFLAGFLMMSMFTVSIAFFYIVLYRREERWTPRGLMRALEMFAVFLVIGLGVGAIQNIPSYELVKTSTRVDATAGYFYKYNSPPQQILSFVFPRYFGWSKTPYRGAWVFSETFGYVGLLPIALAPAALFRKTSWYTRFFAAAGLVALVISFGRVGGLYTLVHKIPGYNVLKDPGRFLMIVDFAVVMLAAIGLDKILDRKEFGHKAMRSWVLLVTGGAVFVVGGLVYMKLLTRYKLLDLVTFKNISLRSSTIYVPVIMIAVVLVLLWMWHKGFFTRNIFAAIIIAFVLFEVFFTGAGINALVPSRIVKETPPPIASIKRDRSLYRVALAKDPGVEIIAFPYQPNQLMTYGLEDARGYSAVETSRYSSFIDEAARRSPLPAFNILNVRYFIASLTNVGATTFDTNMPVNFSAGNDPMSWQVGGHEANRIQLLSTISGGPPLQEGTAIAYLSVKTDSGTRGPFEIKVGEQTGQTEYNTFVARGLVSRKRAVHVKYTTFMGGTRARYLGEVELGGSSRVEEITVVAGPGLSFPGQAFTLTSMNTVGEDSLPVEVGPVTYMDSRTLVYRNLGELPRAYIAGGVVLENNYRSSISALYRYDPSHTVALERSTLAPTLLDKIVKWSPERAVSGRAEPGARGNGMETFEAEASDDGMLLWSGNFIPGWSATLDGKPTRIYPAFGALSAIFMPRGKHRVVFSYSPPGLPTGALLSLLSLILALVGLAWFARGRRGRAAAEVEASQGEDGETRVETEPQAADPAARGVSIFFPACNDETTIEELVRNAISAVERYTQDYEVIVINDGSADHTGEIAERLAASDPRIRVMHHESSRGYGGALKSGFASVTKGLVFYTDGDGQYDSGELGLLMEKRFEADVVNGRKIERNDPLYRRAIGSVYNFTARKVFGIRISDIDCDFRLIRSETIQGLRFESHSGTICLELVKKIQDRGFTFTEVPVHHFERTSGKSQFFKPQSLMRTFKELTVQLWRLQIKRAFLGDRSK